MDRGGSAGRPCLLSLRARPVGVAPVGPADGSHLPAVSAAAEELVAAIGFEPRYTHSRRHVEPLQDLSGSRIDSPHIALVTFPGAVPELAVDPGHAGDEALGLDGAQNGAGLGIDLMDLALAILPHPERPFGPGEPGVGAAAGRRDRRQHTTGRRIEGGQLVSGGNPDVLTVIRDAMHLVDTRKGAVLADDVGG